MKTSKLSFPVICFNHGMAEAVCDYDTLTTTNKLALKPRGWYHGMIIVDQDGHAIRVKSATKLHGVGPFWGYNLFFNQRIKVRLNFDDTPLHVSVEDVRKRVLSSFNQWHGWQTRDDFDELKGSVEQAATVAEIIHLVAS